MDKQKLELLIQQALQEDVGDGDHSTLCCIPADAMGKATLRIKQDTIIAGLEVAEFVFDLLDPNAEFIAHHKDGDSVKDGMIAFDVKAPVHIILKAERLVLNIMQRMSGIATLTHRYVQALEAFHTRLLDTRKTTPNFRLLEKEAVRIGGGLNHRFGLYDMIMLKDNHIDFCGSIEKAIHLAADYVTAHHPHLKIEVETRSIDDVKKVLAVGRVHRIMLDNFTPEQLKTAVELIDKRFETEASGGVTLDTIRDYAASGVDYISCGAIIHQATSVDLSLKAVVAN